MAMAMGLWLAVGPAGRSATYTWDTSTGDGTVTEGPGTWQVGVGNWWDGANDQNWANGHDAVFGAGPGGAGTAGTVVLGGDVSPRKITFNPETAGDYTIDLKGFTLTPTYNSWGTIAGSSGFAPVAISDSVGSGALSIAGGNFSINLTGNALTISAKVTGTGRLFTAGAGSLIVNNDANDFTGLFGKQNGGNLIVTSIADSGVACAAGKGNEIRIGWNGALAYTGSGNSTDRRLSLIGNTGSTLRNNGSGALVFTGTITNTADAGRTFYLGGSNTGSNELQGVLADNGTNVLSVAKNDAGTWKLSGDNTYTGPTTINDGILEVGHSNALGAAAGNTVIANGATLKIAGGVTIPEPISATGNGETGAGGAIWLPSGNSTLTGAIALTAGSTRIQSGSGTLSINGGIAATSGDRNLVLVHNADINSAINLGANGDIFMQVGTKTIDAGGHNWRNAYLHFGVTARLGLNDALPTNSAVIFGWTTAGNSKGTLDLNGFTQTVASIETRSDVLGLGSDLTITGGGTLTVNQAAGTNEYQGRITDGATPTSLVKDGGGTLILNNLSGTPSDFTGGATVKGGALKLGADDTIPDNCVLVLDGGTLEAGAATDNIGSLNVTSDSTLELGAGHLTFGDSRVHTWTGHLTLSGTLGTTALRFLPTLDSNQLSRMSIDGHPVTITPGGYIVEASGGTLMTIR